MRLLMCVLFDCAEPANKVAKDKDAGQAAESTMPNARIQANEGYAAASWG
jgi:hypothetical protein